MQCGVERVECGVERVECGVSSHVTTCNSCHRFCTLSALDAALTMVFANNRQRDTSEVRRLPRKMTMGSPVLRLPRKMQLAIIGTVIRTSRDRPWTVANGCDRKRNVERTHPQPPTPQSETGALATHSGKRLNISGIRIIVPRMESKTNSKSLNV